MSVAALPIYNRIWKSQPLGLGARVLALLIGAACLSVLLVAAWLHPNTHGTGTHTQLGLSACEFKQRTGLPCPSCGMTTSFAYFAHGNIAASFYLQPMGFVLAALSALGVWIGFYAALTGRAVWRVYRFLSLRWFIGMIAFFVVAWAWKIMLTLCGLDGWS